MTTGALVHELELWRMIGSHADLPEVLASLTRFVEAELTGFHAAVFVVHEREARLRLATPSGLPPDIASRLETRPLGLGVEPSLAAAARKQGIFLEDLATAWQRSGDGPTAPMEGIHSSWAVPLLDGTSCIGSLAVYGAQSGLPTARQRQFLEKCAAIAALAIGASQSCTLNSARDAELRCIYDNVSDVLFSVNVLGNHEFHFESANRRFLEATGLPGDQVIGLPLARVIPEPSLSLVVQRYEQAIRERRTMQWEETTAYPAGVKTGEVRVTPVFETDGTCRRLIGSVHDITDQKALQDRLTRTSCLYAALSQCNQAIVQCDTEQQLFENICRTSVEFGGMHFAWIGLHDRATNLLKPVAFHGSGSEYIEDIEVSVDGTKPTGIGPGGTAFRNQRPEWCQEFLSHPALAAWRVRGAKVGWQSMAALPLTCSDRPTGVFFIYSKTAHAFDEDARHLLTEMAMDISFGLTKLHARREQESERIQLQKLSRVVDQSRNLVVISDSNARITYVNPAFERVTGYSSAEVIGRHTNTLMSPRTRRSTYLEIRSRLERGERWRGEVINVKKDGVEFVCLARVSPLRSKDGVTTSYVSVGEDVTEQRRSEKLIEHLTNFDELTGLPNRSHLRRCFDQALDASAKNEGPVALMLLDVDHFRFVNDVEDQTRGNNLLKEVAKRLQDAMGENDVACRIGGDEFAIMLPGIGAREAAGAVRRIQAAFAMPYAVNGASIALTASIGAAVHPDDGADFEVLFRNANLAMYKAKLDGRDCWRSYTEAMHVKTKRMAQIVASLRDAISTDTLEIHYQPLMAGDRIVGAEALVRWNDPALGWIPPSEFIPIAEESGLIVALDDLVLRHSVRQARDWLDSGMGLVVCVNISPVHFRAARLYEDLVELLTDSGLPPRNLELEITEGAAMHDPERAVALLNKLHGLGVRIAIDDFGVGYSSLNYLKRFKIQRLKIDKSFVQDLVADESDRAIVKTIISMAKNLELETVAEGVETREQFEFLTEHGCDLIQGYLFSKPLRATDFTAFWHARTRNHEQLVS